MLPSMRTERDVLQARIKIHASNMDNRNSCKESEPSGFSPKVSGMEQLICLKKKHGQQSLSVFPPENQWENLSQVIGTSDFKSPTHLSRRSLLFNTVGYLERFSLQCPGLLNPFPKHVDIRGRWMWLTEWL